MLKKKLKTLLLIADKREEKRNLKLKNFDLVHHSATIGTTIKNIDLNKIDDETCLKIKELLFKRKVLFFENQDMHPDSHLRLGKVFGDLEIHPYYPHEKHPELLILEKSDKNPGAENIWHSDVSWRLIPSLSSILYCEECPEKLGHTIWTDMNMVYENLDENIKKEIEDLKAVHSYDVFLEGMEMKNYDPKVIEDERRKHPNVVHPVVRVNRDTNEKILYVNSLFTKEIIGKKKDFLKSLLDKVNIPEFQIRKEWRKGDVAIWDNRSTQHYACNDYYPLYRKMRRATIKGEIPINENGFKSIIYSKL